MSTKPSTGSQTRILLFDSLRIEVNGRLVAEFTCRKQDTLLAYLALPPRRPHRRAELAAAIWPGKPIVEARSRLAEALYRLNAELEGFGLTGIIMPGRQTLSVSRDVQTDVAEFDELVRSSGATGAQSREQALALYGGGLLPLFLGIERIEKERARLREVADRLTAELAPAHAAASVGARFTSYATEDAIRLGLTKEPRRDSAPQIADPGRRLAVQCLDLAERAEEELWGSDRRMWIDKLAKMDEELRVAIVWAIESDESDIAVRLTGALWPYWRESGQVDAGRELIERALASAPVQESAAYARALQGAGVLALDRGDFTRATARSQRALVIWQHLGDQERMARCICNLGMVALRTRDYEQARRHFRDSVAVFQRLGLTRVEADALKNAALVELADHRPDEADELLQRRLSLLEGRGDPEAEAWTLVDLATADQQRARWEPATRHLERAKYLFDEAASVRGTAFTLLSLGNVCLETKSVAEARAALSEARDLYHRLNDPRGEGQALRYLAEACTKAGDAKGATALYRQSLSLLRQAGDEAAAAIVEDALEKR